MYESVRDAPETANQSLTRGTVTRSRKLDNQSSICMTRQSHKFEFADSVAESVKGGVLECAFEKGKPMGKGKSTFYGSEYDIPLLGGIIARSKECKDFCYSEMYLVSFKSKINWSFHHHDDCHRLTWEDIGDHVFGPECTSGHYILALGNGERWEVKLIRGWYCNGPWTCTSKNDTIE